MKVDGELSENFPIGVEVNRMCYVTMAVLYLYGWVYEKNES